MEKSHFWTYKIYNSRRQRDKNGQSETRWCGPFYFNEPKNFLQVKGWVREHLGNSDTSHIELKISDSKPKNDGAYSTYYTQLKKELERRAKGMFKRRAVNRNFIIKWLAPDKREIKDLIGS